MAKHTTTVPVVTIEKAWDGNECETQGSNGRTYVSRGRWQWLVIVDGVTDSAHDTRRAAKARVFVLSTRTTLVTCEHCHGPATKTADGLVAHSCPEGRQAKQKKVRHLKSCLFESGRWFCAADCPHHVIVDMEKPSTTDTRLVRIPSRFYDDHVDRSLPTPEPVRYTKQHYFLSVDDPHIGELLNDAEYYADRNGPDMCSRGLIASARQTAQLLRAAGVK